MQQHKRLPTQRSRFNTLPKIKMNPTQNIFYFITLTLHLYSSSFPLLLESTYVGLMHAAECAHLPGGRLLGSSPSLAPANCHRQVQAGGRARVGATPTAVAESKQLAARLKRPCRGRRTLAAPTGSLALPPASGTRPPATALPAAAVVASLARSGSSPSTTPAAMHQAPISPGGKKPQSRHERGDRELDLKNTHMHMGPAFAWESVSRLSQDSATRRGAATHVCAPSSVGVTWSTRALFSCEKKKLDFATVTLLFVYDKYCLIID